MSLPKEQAWFPRKTFGYGWGIPSRWQGWIVMLVYLVVMTLGCLLLPKYPAWFGANVLVASGALVAICAWKGESPRWQWGDSDAT